MTLLDSPLFRRLVIIASGLALVFVLLHFAGIALLRHMVESQLHPALPRGTSIERVDLNVITGDLTVTGFELSDGDQQRIRLAELDIDIVPWEALLGRVHISRVLIRDGALDVRRLEDGGIDLGLPSFGGGSEQTEDKGEPIDFVVDKILLEDIAVAYRDGDLTSQLDIQSVSVGRYALRDASQTVPIDWAMAWDGKAIDGEAELALVDNGVGAEGRLTTDLLDLGKGAQLGRLGEPVAGMLAFDGTFAWKAPELRLGGSLEVPELAYNVAERRMHMQELVVPAFELELVTEPELSVTFTPTEVARLQQVEAELEGQRIVGSDYRIQGVVAYDAAGRITGDVSNEVGGFSWHSGPMKVAVTGVKLDGKIEQSLAGDTPYPGLDAKVTVDGIEFQDTDATLVLNLQQVVFDKIALSQADEAGARQLDADIETGVLRVQQQDNDVRFERMQGALGGSLAASGVALNGGLEISQLEAAMPTSDLSVQLERLGVDRMSLAQADTGVSVNADLKIANAQLSTPTFAHGPLTIGQLDASGIDVAEATSFKKLKVTGIRLPSVPEQTTLEVASIEVPDGRYSPDDGVALGKIVIDSLQAGMIRDKEGVWRYAPADSEAGEDKKPAADAQAGEPLPWRLGGVAFVGETRLAVNDETNPDREAQVLSIERLEVGALGTATPDTDTAFALKLRPDKFSEFDIEGTARPLADPPAVKAAGHIQGWPLQAFNGFIANDLGHRFTDGQLDNEFSIEIASNQLDMGNTLAITSVAAEAIEGKSGPPLGAAIALLEDRDGNIKLEVPVSGDMTDPNFRVLGALNPIIMKAVAGGAALAIQPLGSVLLVGTLAADQALKVTFPPATFDPGSVELNDGAKDYLSQLAEKLKEKPKLGLRFCGVSVAVERAKDKQGKFTETEEQMLDRANDRSTAVRAYLQQQGVGEKQLRLCRPAFDQTPEGQPRVDVMF